MKLLIFGLILFVACSPKPQEPTLTWYKGNTHVHTVLCGHADAHPDTVANWYLDRGYNFLILSEHNQFIDPESINLPADRRADFILVPGEEVTDYESVHTTAMNIHRALLPQRPIELSTIVDNPYDNYKIYLMKKHTDSIRNAGGIPILNHPNFAAGVPASDIEQVDGLNMIELYNGHPDVNNWGNEKFPSMEQKWDSLLTAGRKVYGVSSDDAHSFHTWGVDVSNPGRGWVMVQSEQLTADALTNAMVRGDFYASSGVILKSVIQNAESYSIEIDVDKTLTEIESPYVVGYKTELAKDGFSIEFISEKGEVISKKEAITARVVIPEGVKYVRGKVTYSRNRSSKSEQFFAWTQPIFLQ